MKIKEKTIENRLQKFYAGEFITKRQVRISQKRIDLVTKCPVTSEMWAIEIKIKDWKGAVRQALLNTIACDKSYVALWHEYAKPAMKNQEMFRNLGIGLMIISAEYQPQIVVKSKACSNINTIAYDKVFSSL